MHVDIGLVNYTNLTEIYKMYFMSSTVKLLKSFVT